MIFSHYFDRIESTKGGEDRKNEKTSKNNFDYVDIMPCRTAKSVC